MGYQKTIIITLISILAPSLLAQEAENNIAQVCDYDRDAMLALDEQAFDQDMNGGWRTLARDPCLEVAADLIRDYREVNEIETSISYWHEGQLRATAGMRDEAIPLLEKARHDPDEDKFGWNYYVDATIAFLNSDKAALEKARENLAQIHKPENLPMNDINGNPIEISWPPNLDVVDGLIACFEKNYSEAYGINCRP